ncbi:MAG TPA: sulfurtransferase [Gammaproteobacteria bacterium]|nr:sulfurtransferase [Gammaproteobacteria bacterium]
MLLINPIEASALLAQDPNARLIDVRSKVEFEYVGHPLNAIHIPWKEFPEWSENRNFVADVDARLADDGNSSRDRALLMLCRSGVRSLHAGKTLLSGGYTRVYNIEGGFEGDPDTEKHRGNINGWRFHGLPWEQS